ncbi:MAG: DUF2752 domain-containing protein [Prevotella sp.]|jgi:hypothetical protein|nr:DUF2752 domain-containing protein [Prevotella sp.]
MKWERALPVVAVALAVVYYCYEPTPDALYPKCIFVRLTGWQCAGCGMQRAVHSLLHLRFAEAFHYNAYFVIVLPLLLALLFQYYWRSCLPRFHAVLTSQPVLWLLGISALIWWIARNTFTSL